MEPLKPIEWIVNPSAAAGAPSAALADILPPDISRLARSFHRQIPGFKMSPLKSLAHLAEMLGVGGIWVKDESQRMSLRSFKVLGGSFAIYRFIKAKLGLDHLEVPLAELSSPEVRAKLGDLTFAAATDGNHGRGVAWAAAQLGFKSVIYVHKFTSQARIQAIASLGARVEVIDGTYDDAVRQITLDAEQHGWHVISDTSWEGYQDIPKWVMQGYTTMLSEVQEQLAAQGFVKPTHVFVQAGVGALAAATIGFYAKRFGAERPKTAVVEPDRAACLYRSIEAGDGAPHSFPGDLNTIMAGLACGDPSPLAWSILKDYADVFVQCPDYVAGTGMRVYAVPLEGDPFIVSGESGAVTLGALLFAMQLPEYAGLRERLELGPDSHILLLNTEGNTDPDHFRRIVWEGGDPVPNRYKTYHLSA